MALPPVSEATTISPMPSSSARSRANSNAFWVLISPRLWK
jgi:hypothetical protein